MCERTIAVLQSARKHPLFKRSVAESSTDAINIAVPAKGNQNLYLETLNLFQNAYLLRVHHQFLGYIADKLEERLVKEAMFSLGR